MKEEKIIKDIMAYLTKELHIDLQISPIKIWLEGDAIVMEGQLDSIAYKKKALLKAISIPGTSGVIDRLRVRPSKEMSDKEITNHLSDALTEESSIDESSINIEINNGVVDLEGTVPSLSHKRLAGVLAWWVPGSTEIINSLDVQPPEEDSDDEVTDAIKIVFEKDRLVDSSSILVATKGWVVTLSGTVNDDIERKAAENDAWYVWGVDGVVNNIKVIR
ncbi:MAG: BON domain-containing protein [Thermodesulfobacteriota bacterium]